jgi:hypothetical protein
LAAPELGSFDQKKAAGNAETGGGNLPTANDVERSTATPTNGLRRRL